MINDQISRSLLIEGLSQVLIIYYSESLYRMNSVLAIIT